MDAALYDRAERMVKRSGMSLEVPPPVEEVEHVPATDQMQQHQQQRVGFGNENRDNNDRRFKNLYSQSDIRYDDDVDDHDHASSQEYQPTIIKTGRKRSYSPTTLADEQTGNRINLAEERLKWEQQQQERNEKENENERQSLEHHYNTVTNGNKTKKNINGGSSDGDDSATSNKMMKVKEEGFLFDLDRHCRHVCRIPREGIRLYLA